MSKAVKVINLAVGGVALAVLLLVVLGPYYAATGLVVYAVARALPAKLKASAKSIAVCCAALLCIAAARPIGNVHAGVVHFLGIDALMTFGYCQGPCRAAKQILHDRYGVRMIPIAGCVVIGPEVWYTRGFNEVMIPLVVRDRGTDVFEAAHDEAWAPWRGSQSVGPQQSDVP